MEVGYIGNVSHHLTANDLSLNQVAPQLMGPGDAQARRPFPQFSNVTWINPSIGNSTYHGGFVRAEKRFSGGFSFLAHYTFSKFIDDVESANEYGATGSYMDAYNRRLDKGLSGSDVPHHLVVTAAVRSAAVRAQSRREAVLGGWKVGLLETAESGAPFTVITTANTTNAFPAGSLRPNLLRDRGAAVGSASITRWFDTRAFAAPAPFTFGNSPRSGLRGAPVDHGRHAGEDLPVARERGVRPARRVLQPPESRELQRPRRHVWRGRFRRRDQRAAGRTVQLAGRLSF